MSSFAPRPDADEPMRIVPDAPIPAPVVPRLWPADGTIGAACDDCGLVQDPATHDSADDCIRALRGALAAARAREGAAVDDAIAALLEHCEVRASRTMEPRKSEWLRRATAVRALGAWREAVLDAAVARWTLTAEHERDPRAAVNALLAHAQQVALDPAVSAEARALTDAARTRFAEARDAAVRVLHDAITDTTSPCVAIGCTTCRRHRLHAALAEASRLLTEPVAALRPARDDSTEVGRG